MKIEYISDSKVQGLFSILNFSFNRIKKSDISLLPDFCNYRKNIGFLEFKTDNYS